MQTCYYDHDQKKEKTDLIFQKKWRARNSSQFRITQDLTGPGAVLELRLETAQALADGPNSRDDLCLLYSVQRRTSHDVKY